MQFTVAAFFALAGSAIAQYVDPTPGFNPLTKPTTNEVIPAGKPYTIKWTQGGQAGPVSLYAYAGESASTLQEVGTIATGLDASLGMYEWQVEPSLGGKYKAYGIKIALASDKTVYQWSNPFTISGDASSSSSASASSSVASTSSSSVSAKTDSTTVTSATSSAAPTTSSSVIITTTPRSNLSTTVTTASTQAPTSQVTLVTSTSRGPASPSGSTTAPTTVPTGGAIARGASSLAVIGGLAMVVLAM